MHRDSTTWLGEVRKILFERQRDLQLPAERLQNLQMHSIPSAVEMVWIVKQNRVLHKFFCKASNSTLLVVQRRSK